MSQSISATLHALLTAVRTFMYSPIPLTRAAWWKYPAVMHFLISCQRHIPTSHHRSPYDIPVSPHRKYLHLLLLHDILQLAADFACFPHELRMEEMLHAPMIAVTAR